MCAAIGVIINDDDYDDNPNGHKATIGAHELQLCYWHNWMSLLRHYCHFSVFASTKLAG